MNTRFLLSLLILMTLTIPAPTPARAAPIGGHLYALMTTCLGGCFFGPPTYSAIEIVDLATLKPIRTFSIGARTVASLAVSPNEQQLFVVDQTNSAIDVFSSTGTLIKSIPVLSPGDEVISPNGTRLYVSGGGFGAGFIAAIDTASLKVVGNLTTGRDTPLGVALSPDGSILGAPSTQGGGSPAFYLVNAGTLTNRTRTSISGGGVGCATFPNDVAFTDTGVALLFDDNCDKEYQVVAVNGTQLTGKTIDFVRDSGSSANSQNIIAYSPVSARSYAVNTTRLLVGNPATAAGVNYGGFSGLAFVPALTPDRGTLLISVIHRFSGGGADTLDSFDTIGNTFTRGIYTFTNATMSALDMQILPPPPPPLTATGAATPLSVDVGQTVSFTCSGSGGTGGYTYSWAFGDGSTGNTQNPNHIYTSPGAMNAVCTVTDSSSSRAQSSASITVSSDPLVDTPTAQPAQPSVGQVLNLAVRVSGGYGSYNYAWMGLPSGCNSANSAAITCTPMVSGTFNVTVIVTDSNGYTVTSNPLVLTVGATPLAPQQSQTFALVAGIGIVTAAIIAAVVMMTRRRRRSVSPTPSKAQ